MSRRRFFRSVGGAALSMVAGGVIGGGLTSRWYRTQIDDPLEPQIDGVQVPPITVTTPGGTTVHGIQTGFVAVKGVHREYNGNSNPILAIVAATEWTEWMPVYAWVIEHNEGVIVIDTGETHKVYNGEYFDCDPVSNFIYTNQLRFALTEQDEIGAQLQMLGIDPAQDVRYVVQTHMHSDHMGGLYAFEGVEVLMSRAEFGNPQALTCRYPEWLEPTLLDYEGGAFENFQRSHVLTQAGDVILVPTPGHTDGHQSVMLLDGDLTYFFGGDVSFDEAQLLNGTRAGIAINPEAAAQTLQTIRSYAGANPTVFLTAHDHESGTRLANPQTVQV
ncbi:MAG: N-acyl homoserine lactonase family protein [Chloroflexota bacterium]